MPDACKCIPGRSFACIFQIYVVLLSYSTIWQPCCNLPPHSTAIFCHITPFLFVLPILSSSLSKFFLLFLSSPLFIPLRLFEYLFLFVSLIILSLPLPFFFFSIFLFPLSYFFLSFRDYFVFLPFFIYFSVYFILSLFVPLRFILFPSVSLYNVFSLSLSHSLIIYCSLFITPSGHGCHSCHNTVITHKSRQFQQTACQVSLSDI